MDVFRALVSVTEAFRYPGVWNDIFTGQKRGQSSVNFTTVIGVAPPVTGRAVRRAVGPGWPTVSFFFTTRHRRLHSQPRGAHYRRAPGVYSIEAAALFVPPTDGERGIPRRPRSRRDRSIAPDRTGKGKGREQTRSPTARQLSAGVRD